MVILKSFSKISNICITSLPFLIQILISLVLSIICDFLIYPGHFGCYVVRHWIISHFSLFQVVDLFSRSKWDGYSALHMALATPERRVGTSLHSSHSTCLPLGGVEAQVLLDPLTPKMERKWHVDQYYLEPTCSASERG